VILLTTVSNATPLIYLGKLTKFSFLKELYGEVIVPTGVWVEIVKPITEAWEQMPEDLAHILQAHEKGWLKVGSVETKDGLRAPHGLRLTDKNFKGTGERYGDFFRLDDGSSLSSSKRNTSLSSPSESLCVSFCTESTLYWPKKVYCPGDFFSNT